MLSCQPKPMFHCDQTYDVRNYSCTSVCVLIMRSTMNNYYNYIHYTNEVLYIHATHQGLRAY